MTVTVWLKPFYAPADRMIIPFMIAVSSLHGNRLNNWAPKTAQHEDSKTDNSLQDFCLNFIYIYVCNIYIHIYKKYVYYILNYYDSRNKAKYPNSMKLSNWYRSNTVRFLLWKMSKIF